MTVSDTSLDESGSNSPKVAATSLLLRTTRGSSDAYSATANGFTWNMSNWHNNNNNWSFVKAGPKKGNNESVNTSVAAIVTSTTMSESIKTIVVTIDKIIDKASVSSIVLESASKVDFSDSKTIETKSNVLAGEVKFTILSPKSNQYYKLTFNCSNTSTTGGVVQVSKVTYSNE